MHEVVLASVVMDRVQQPGVRVHWPITTTAVYSRKFSRSQEETLHLFGAPLLLPHTPSCPCCPRDHMACVSGLHLSHHALGYTHTGVQVSLQPSEHPAHGHTFSRIHLLMDAGIPSHHLGKRCDPVIPRARICPCRPHGRMPSWVQADIQWPGAPSSSPCSLTS